MYLPVLIDTACRSFFQHPPDRPDFRRTDCANFQTHLEDQIPFHPEFHNGMAIEACDENFTGAVQAASNLKCRPRDDPRPPIPAGIQYEIRLKNRLRRQWQITRDPALKTEVIRLQRVTRRLNEWRNEQWSTTLESLDPEDQSLWSITKWAMRVPTPSTPWSSQGESLQEAIRGLKVSNATGPNVIPNRALKYTYIPQRTVSFLVLNFNAILLTQYFPTVWKQVRVIYILKPGKGPVLPSSYRPITLLNTIGKLFERS